MWCIADMIYRPWVFFAHVTFRPCDNLSKWYIVHVIYRPLLYHPCNNHPYDMSPMQKSLMWYITHVTIAHVIYHPCNNRSCDISPIGFTSTLFDPKTKQLKKNAWALIVCFCFRRFFRWALIWSWRIIFRCLCQPNIKSRKARLAEFFSTRQQKKRLGNGYRTGRVKFKWSEVGRLPCFPRNL